MKQSKEAKQFLRSTGKNPDKELRSFLKAGGRGDVEEDFNQTLKKASRPQSS